MKPLALATFAVLLIAHGVAARAQQPAAVQGVVVRWTSSEPVAKASVELQSTSANDKAPFVTTSDGSGAFAFRGVQPGTYRLFATRAGYVTAEYGQRRPGGAGMTLTIPAAQSVTVQLTMSPTGVIAGRVVDRSGQPLGNADVQAFRSSYSDGRRVLTRVQATETNDLGEYRLFDLAPGRYYVGASHPDSGDMTKMLRLAGMSVGPQGFTRATGDNAGLPGSAFLRMGNRMQTPVRSTVYYPGTIDEQSASPLEVGPASEIGSIEIVVDDAAMQHVRGRVISEATGEPARSAKVQALSPSGVSAVATPGEGLFGLADVDSDNGTFDVMLAPGSHLLVATVGNLVGRVPIQVGYADVDNVTIGLSAGFNVTGRLLIEGRPPTEAEMAPFVISLLPDPPIVREFAPYSVPVGSGSLTLAAGRGDFRVSVSPLLALGPPRPGPPPKALPPTLEGAYVKSIQLGGVDILNERLHLEQPTDAQLVITIGTSPGSLDGSVANAARQPVPNATVALLPDVERRNRFDLMRSTETDLSGRFRFDRLPPGDYRLFAWEDIEPGTWFDPDAMRAFDDRGTPVRVDERGRMTVDVVAIR